MRCLQTLGDRGRLPSQEYMDMRDECDMSIQMDLLCPDEAYYGALSSYSAFMLDALQAHETTYLWGAKENLVEWVEEPWATLDVALFEGYTEFQLVDFLVVCDLFEQLPDVIRTPQKCKATKRFVIFLVLFRWRPRGGTEWTCIEERLGHNKSRLVALYTTAIRMIFDNENYHALATKIDVPRMQHQFAEMAERVTELGALLEDVVGFIDCAPRETCVPSKPAARKRKFNTDDVQALAYSGHYKKHGEKIQDIVFVDGMVIREVRLLAMHDSKVLTMSKVKDTLRAIHMPTAAQPGGDPQRHPCLYGDPAYQEDDVIKRKSKGVRSTAQRTVDKSMQSCRGAIASIY